MLRVSRFLAFIVYVYTVGLGLSFMLFCQHSIVQYMVKYTIKAKKRETLSMSRNHFRKQTAH